MRREIKEQSITFRMKWGLKKGSQWGRMLNEASFRWWELRWLVHQQSAEGWRRDPC